MAKIIGGHHHLARARHRRRHRHKGLQQDPYWKPFFDGFPPGAPLAGERSSPTSWW
jgi:hypothetical protein